jgi:hypothetical protein
MNPRPLPRLFLLLALVLAPVLAFAADDAFDAVRRADDARVAATLAADRAGLERTLSDDLHYVHASGKTDTKASYIQSFVSHATIYDTSTYPERKFQSAGPGVVLMTGRSLIHSRTGGGIDHDLNFLAVWREENGVWRLLAWQSSERAPAAGGAKGK